MLFEIIETIRVFFIYENLKSLKGNSIIEYTTEEIRRGKRKRKDSKDAIRRVEKINAQFYSCYERKFFSLALDFFKRKKSIRATKKN